MFIGIYKTDRPFGLILLPFIIGALHIPFFLKPVEEDYSYSMPLYDILEKIFSGRPQLASAVSCLLVFIEALLLNRIAINTAIFRKNNWIPSLAYVVFLSIHPGLLSLHPVIPANLFLVPAVGKVISRFRDDKAIFPSFDTGLLISIAALFYFPCAIFIIWSFIALMIFRTFYWREWVAVIMGFIVPLIFTVSCYYCFGLLYASNLMDKIWQSFYSSRNINGIPYWALVAFFTILSLVAIIRMLLMRGSLTVKQRKIIISGAWFIVTGVSTALLHVDYHLIFALCAPVLAAMFTQMFFDMDHLTGEIVFFLMIAAISVYSYNWIYQFLPFH